MSFADLGLSDPILAAVKEQGYTTPSPIQAKAIPPILQGKDVMAAAQTGTGKTAGFTLPILDILSRGERAKSNQVRTLILTPTRELAAQIAESCENYGKNLPLRSDVVFGGVKASPQMMRMRRGADILVATPGRLLDLFNQGAVKFKQLEILVLDEADRMLDMGFIHDIRKIIAVLPKQRQNLLFSATFSEDIRSLARTIVNNPIEISVTPRNSTAKTVKQWICPVDKKRKPALLVHLIKEHNWGQVLVFCRTKHGANRLTRYLEEHKITASAIHGNKSQGARTKALQSFKDGSVCALVATDIAARGLDIDQLPQVVNFDLPNVSEDYVHRIGRTGRAGASGQAVSLVCADECDDLFGIERLIQQVLPRELVDDFEPIHDIPESRLDRRPIKAKKPKKPQHSSGHSSEGHSDGRPARRPQQRSGTPRRGGSAANPSGGRSQNANKPARQGQGASTAPSGGAPSNPSGNRRPSQPRNRRPSSPST